MDCNVSIYLDKRSKKKNGQRPIKLRVYSSIIRKAKFYGVGLAIAQKDFDAIIDPNTKVRGNNREMQLKIQEFENRASKVANSLDPFTFEQFEKKMFRSKNASINVNYHYNNKITSLVSNGQLSTASSYELSLKSLEGFIIKKWNKKINELSFYDIVPEFLNGYENFMVKELERSRTTVAIYLRSLRTVFNDAITSNDIKKEIYPFGKEKGKYQIPNPKGKKSALTREQLALLFNTKPRTQEQEKAKDFWFFSYACNGMNIKDIALLRNKDINKEVMTYYRAKTINTKKGNLKKINIFLNNYAKGVIQKYRRDLNHTDFVFPILERNDSLEIQQKKIQNFTRFVNQHINRLTEGVGFEFKISTYWARHSFATNSIRNGASMEFISEALNHSNLNTTRAYFAGFEDEKKKEFADQLMDF